MPTMKELVYDWLYAWITPIIEDLHWAWMRDPDNKVKEYNDWLMWHGLRADIERACDIGW